MTYFLGELVKGLMGKEIKEGEIASINCKIYGFDDGMMIAIWGINNKIDLMLNEVLSLIANFNPAESQFKSGKKHLTEDWKSQLLSE